MKPFLGVFLCEIQSLAISRGGSRAGTCQIVVVTVSNRLHLFEQFLNLYIFIDDVGGGKMYNLKKCSTMPRRMLIVTLRLYDFANRYYLKNFHLFSFLFLTLGVRRCILCVFRGTRDKSTRCWPPLHPRNATYLSSWILSFLLSLSPSPRLFTKLLKKPSTRLS